MKVKRRTMSTVKAVSSEIITAAAVGVVIGVAAMPAVFVGRLIQNAMRDHA